MLSKNFSNFILKNNIDINSFNIYKIIKLRLNKSINRILPLLRFSKYPFKKIRMKDWKGAKTCNLALWKKDFENINGYDENYIGWGREDSDLVVRLINNKIF